MVRISLRGRRRQIEVEFSIDANGILSVSATDKATGKSHNVEINGSSGLPEEEIERMKLEAEQNAESDKAKRELVETRNRAEQVAYSTRKSLEEHGDKVEADVRAEIESAIANLEDKISGEDKAAIEAALANLEKAAAELGKAAYDAAAADAAAAEDGSTADSASGASGAADGDDVIDADFEVKDE